MCGRRTDTVTASWQEEKKDGGGGGEEEEEVKVDTFKFIGVRRLKGECLVRKGGRQKARGVLGLVSCSGGNSDSLIWMHDIGNNITL